MEQKLRDAKGRGEVTAQHRNKIFAVRSAPRHAARRVLTCCRVVHCRS